MRRLNRVTLLLGVGLLIVCCAAAGAGGAYILLRRPVPAPHPVVEYILDVSPRMGQPFKGQPRLDAARTVLAEVLRPSAAGTSAGLRVFGSGAAADACQDTSLVVPLAAANVDRITQGAQVLQTGKSPSSALAQAMIAGIHDLRGAGGQGALVVITGGADSCNPDAAALVQQESARAGVKLEAFVIGLDTPAEETQAIKDLVSASGGVYVDAPDPDTLAAVLRAIQAHIDQPASTSIDQIRAAATPGAEPALAYQPQTACDYPYYPIRAGASWTYTQSGGGRNFTTVTSVKRVSGDLQQASAVISSQNQDGSGQESEWTCSADGLRERFSSSSGSNGSSTQYDLLSFDGQTFPPANHLIPGYAWNFKYTMRAGGTSSSSSAASAVTTVSQQAAVKGPARLTIGSGTFDVLVIASTTNEATGNGPAATYTTTANYALGVGMVQAVTAGTGGTYTYELTSYTLPK